VGKYILRRLLLLIPTLVGMSLLIFLLLRLLPGDVVDILLGGDQQADSASKAALRTSLGLTDPLPVQYVRWVSHLVRGDLGTSLRSGQSVSALLLRAMPVTLELAGLAVVIGTCVAVPLGVISAVKRDTIFDFGARVTGLIGLSLPNFWIATLALLLTSTKFHWIPEINYINPLHDPFGNLKQMILPSAAIAVGLMAIVMRMTRVHPHCPRQGAAGSDCRLSPRAAKRLDPGNYGDRFPVGRAARRLGDHGGHFRPQWPRKHAPASDLQP